MSNERRQKRNWLRPLLGTLAGLAVVGGSAAYLILSEWTDYVNVAPAEVESVFATAHRAAGGGVPYVELNNQGAAIVHREQERDAKPGFDTLTLLAWAPGDDKVLRVEYPRWFVRLKTSSFVNLGTMIAAVRKDWRHLDLSIKYADLMRRGPGLVLDHQAKNGARILLWTSVRGG